MPINTDITRRTTLGLIAGAAAGAVATSRALAQPAVRDRVQISYWTWADNPDHQQRLVNAVDRFNASQEFITVTLDASSRTAEFRQKLAVAVAAGAAPDVAGSVQTHVQDWYNTGVLEPIDDYFAQWDEAGDFFPNMVAAMRSKPDQPVLYLTTMMLPYVLYYRADWFDEAAMAPPTTYDEFIAAAKTIAETPDRYGYALRGADYFGTQVIEPIWGSAGVDFVKPDGTIDFASDAAMAVTDKWVGMLTRDHSAQPTAITDAYPQLFSLMESGRCGMWIYGAHGLPQLDAALGDRIQAVATPTVGARDCMLTNPTGLFILSTSPEKDAAWEFMKFMASGETALSIGPERGYMPVRSSLSDLPIVQNNRVLQVVRANADNWWTPPFYADNWVNYQDSIAPYWQQLLREEMSVADYHARAASLLAGGR